VLTIHSLSAFDEVLYYARVQNGTSVQIATRASRVCAQQNTDLWRPSHTLKNYKMVAERGYAFKRPTDIFKQLTVTFQLRFCTLLVTV